MAPEVHTEFIFGCFVYTFGWLAVVLLIAGFTIRQSICNHTHWKCLIIGIERVAPKEGETTAALRLLDELRSWHYYYADVVALDSLYAGAPVINKLHDQNVIGVIRVKQEHYNLVQDAEGLFLKSNPDLVKKGVSIKSDWYEEDRAGRKYNYDLKIWDAEGFTTWEKISKPLRIFSK